MLFGRFRNVLDEEVDKITGFLVIRSELSPEARQTSIRNGMANLKRQLRNAADELEKDVLATVFSKKENS